MRDMRGGMEVRCKSREIGVMGYIGVEWALFILPATMYVYVSESVRESVRERR